MAQTKDEIQLMKEKLAALDAQIAHKTEVMIDQRKDNQPPLPQLPPSAQQQPPEPPEPRLSPQRSTSPPVIQRRSPPPPQTQRNPPPTSQRNPSPPLRSRLVLPPPPIRRAPSPSPPSASSLSPPISRPVPATSSNIQSQSPSTPPKPGPSTPDKEPQIKPTVPPSIANQDRSQPPRVLPPKPRIRSQTESSLSSRKPVLPVAPDISFSCNIRLLVAHERLYSPAITPRNIVAAHLGSKDPSNSEKFGLFSSDIGWMDDVTPLGKVKGIDRVNDLKGVVEVRRREDSTDDSMNLQIRLKFPPDFSTVSRIFALRRDMTASEALSEIIARLEERGETAEDLDRLKSNPEDWILVRIRQEKILGDSELLSLPTASQLMEFELRKKHEEVKQQKKKKGLKGFKTRLTRAHTLGSIEGET